MRRRFPAKKMWHTPLPDELTSDWVYGPVYAESKPEFIGLTDYQFFFRNGAPLRARVKLCYWLTINFFTSLAFAIKILPIDPRPPTPPKKKKTNKQTNEQTERKSNKMATKKNNNKTFTHTLNFRSVVIKPLVLRSLAILKSR